MTELEFAIKVDSAGGTAYLVGGAVRDKYRNVRAHDRDYCITGLTEKIFAGNFPDALKFGKSFPVFSIEIDGEMCEVALARTEKKSGTGYHGFKVNFSPGVTIEEDLFRRDTTINAMAIKILSGELVDPFGGVQDVLQKKIRAVSEHFTDDPVRALRAARQSSQFDFEIVPETLHAMNLCADELKCEPGERIFSELQNALKTDKPSIFFRNLDKAGLLEIIFPEIANLKGKTQPEKFHPEGDAYEHSLQILDEVAKVNSKPVVRFSALVHDLGKGQTPPEMLPHHYMHEKKGLDVLDKMAARIHLPGNWKKISKFVMEEHMRAPTMTAPGKITDFLLKLQKSKIATKDFNDIIRADHHGLPPHLEKADFILRELLKVNADSVPKIFVGEEIGRELRLNRIRRFVELRDNL